MIVNERMDLTDELLELYYDWRIRCEEVRANYERFSSAARADRASAFAAFEAALDREASAAAAYAVHPRRVVIAA